jgi:hypothetical protein
MNFLRDVCEIADLIDVVIGYVDTVRLSMEFIVWYERYRGLTSLQWKEIYTKRYHDLTFEFVATYQDKFSDFRAAPLKYIIRSFTVCVKNFYMLREKNRKKWMGHCLMHPGVKLQDIPCQYTYTIYDLLTLEDKYWLYQNRRHDFILAADRNTIRLIGRISNVKQGLMRIQGLDFMRMFKDNKLSLKQVLNLYDQKYLDSEIILQLIWIKYHTKFDKYSDHPLVQKLKIEHSYWRSWRHYKNEMHNTYT